MKRVLHAVVIAVRLAVMMVEMEKEKGTEQDMFSTFHFSVSFCFSVKLNLVIVKCVANIVVLFAIRVNSGG